MIAIIDQDDPELDNVFILATKSLDLLFIILPNTIPLYNRIKHCGDVKYGIQTICAVGHQIAKERGQDQYFANVALKFNLKLGGNNQLLDKQCLGIINEDKTMVVGIDVTHPSPGSSSRAPSIAGMVASVDRWLGQWPAVLLAQAGARQEMVTGLSDMLKSRLQLWKTKGYHQFLPENILVYRDGVSEGQYDKVVNEELPRLRKACTEVYPASDQKRGLPHFTIVIVGKGHHTRFYPTKETDADRSGNPKPDTIVDRGVTEARNWDFFLQAHAAIQGTARPGHYVVVLDEIFRARYAKTLAPGFNNVADVLEDLTQSLCYVYGRSTKAVSLCTPAYCADIVCERARCYLSGVFDTPTQSAGPSLAGSQTGGLQVGNEDATDRKAMNPFTLYRDDGSSDPQYRATVESVEASIGRQPCECVDCQNGFYTVKEQYSPGLSSRRRLSDKEAERSVLSAVEDIHRRRASLTKRIDVFGDVLLSRWKKRSQEKREAF
ncbi:Hypothetical protein NCS54_01488100 [Fusarium falciforme]|uniref:Hypothetical protein n=1 Tax=Fusarium falciforme TaxID=195108 RepID=UPI0023011C19|nr:Hypothetical protein NCS54_01488100 [Fusarium falciforme]WAO97167.1 Hypothetical protein NCS54_01488100 [Fusarium falciforme]